MRNTEGISRRSLLQALASTPILHGHGQIKPPIPVPEISVVRHDGTAMNFQTLVSGHVTAVQLMFTECTTTCPIEAAIFEGVQKRLRGMNEHGIQLLSLSVAPENDTPKAMSAWLRRFHAGPAWIAAAPIAADAARVRNFFQKGANAADHSTQVSILDRAGRLVWRTYELPDAQEVAGILRRV